jgi:hypothetical protein
MYKGYISPSKLLFVRGAAAFFCVSRFSAATTSRSVGLSGACMCENSCMSRDGGFQAVRAAGRKLQIRTFFFI